MGWFFLIGPPEGILSRRYRTYRLAECSARCRVGKNSPPDCFLPKPFGFLPPCSNSFLLYLKKRTNPHGLVLFNWPARRDSNPWPSESESAAISSFATGGYLPLLAAFYFSFLRLGSAITAFINLLPCSEYFATSFFFSSWVPSTMRRTR